MTDSPLPLAAAPAQAAQPSATANAPAAPIAARASNDPNLLAASQDEPVVKAGAPSANDTAIDQWFMEHMSNSLISRDTRTYNFVRDAVEVLKQRLGGK